MAHRNQVSSHAVPERTPRADARRNRERLLAAAEAVFEEQGADAALEEVARRAQVGIGTLYRHFPTREELLSAAWAERLSLLAAKSQRQAASLSPVKALSRFLEEIARCAGSYSGLAAAFGVVLKSGTPGCHAVMTQGQTLLERAQREKELRRDVTFDELVRLTLAVSSTLEPGATQHVRRFIALFMDGVRVR